MRKGETANGEPGTSAEGGGEKTQARRGKRERRQIIKETRKENNWK